MIDIFDAAVADATVAFSPVLGSAPLGAPAFVSASAASAVQMWNRSSAFGPSHEPAVAAGADVAAGANVAAASGANLGAAGTRDAVAPGTNSVAPAARRHRAAGASVLDSRHRSCFR